MPIGSFLVSKAFERGVLAIFMRRDRVALVASVLGLRVTLASLTHEEVAEAFPEFAESLAGAVRG